MKLVRKLTIAIFLGLVLVFAVTGTMHVRNLLRLYEEDTHQDHYDLGYGIASSVSEVWKAEGRQAALDFVKQLNVPGKHVEVRWLDEVPDAARSGATDSIDRSGRYPIFRTTIPVRVAGELQGAIRLDEPLPDERQYVGATVTSTVIEVLLSAIVSGLLAVSLGIVLVGRPMQALVEGARRIGAGKLDERITLRQHDELGELADELNASCARLAETQHKLSNETAARIATLEQLRHAERLVTVGKLATGLAHELGTPLNVVLLRAREIASGEVEGVAAKADASAIAEQTERMTRIIRQLLEFARRATPRKESQRLCTVVQDALVLVEPIARKRQVEIETRFPDPAVTAEVDRNQIQQVVTNLAVNGIQSMKEGGRLTVGVSRERTTPPPDHGGAAGEFVMFWVEDEGTGIAPDVLPRIFEPFFTTKDVGEGSGLGLSVSYGLVQDHGGWIAVDTQPGKGSRFSVYLP